MKTISSPKNQFVRLLVALTLVLSVFFLPAGAARSAPDTITVTNDNDSGDGTLRQAIADIGDGGTITFDGDYTILLESELDIDKNLTIDGGIEQYCA